MSNFSKLNNSVKFYPLSSISSKDTYYPVVDKLTNYIFDFVIEKGVLKYKKDKIHLALKILIEHLILAYYYDKCIVFPKSKEIYDYYKREGISEVTYYQIMKLYKFLKDKVDFVYEVFTPEKNPKKYRKVNRRKGKGKSNRSIDIQNMATRISPTEYFIELLNSFELEEGISLRSKIELLDVDGNYAALYKLPWSTKTEDKFNEGAIIHINSKSEMKTLSKNKRFRNRIKRNSNGAELYISSAEKEDEFEQIRNNVRSYNEFIRNFSVILIEDNSRMDDLLNLGSTFGASEEYDTRTEQVGLDIEPPDFYSDLIHSSLSDEEDNVLAFNSSSDASATDEDSEFGFYNPSDFGRDWFRLEFALDYPIDIPSTPYAGSQIDFGNVIGPYPHVMEDTAEVEISDFASDMDRQHLDDVNSDVMFHDKRITEEELHHRLQNGAATDIHHLGCVSEIEIASNCISEGYEADSARCILNSDDYQTKPEWEIEADDVSSISQDNLQVAIPDGNGTAMPLPSCNGKANGQPSIECKWWTDDQTGQLHTGDNQYLNADVRLTYLERKAGTDLSVLLDYMHNSCHAVINYLYTPYIPSKFNFEDLFENQNGIEQPKSDILLDELSPDQVIRARELEPRLYRVFNDIDLTKGGRFYGAQYQGLNKSQREKILIIDKRTNQIYETVELDYKSLHLKILYDINGINFEGSDYYIFDGVAQELRPFIKILTNILLNSSNRVQAEISIKKTLEDDQELSILFDTYTDPKKSRKARISRLINLILEAHSPIKSYFHSGIGIKIQRLDSDIAERILLEFKEQGIPCLCIHDSFIVPKIYEEKLEELRHRVLAEITNEYKGKF